MITLSPTFQSKLVNISMRNTSFISSCQSCTIGRALVSVPHPEHSGTQQRRFNEYKLDSISSGKPAAQTHKQREIVRLDRLSLAPAPRVSLHKKKAHTKSVHPLFCSVCGAWFPCQTQVLRNPIVIKQTTPEQYGYFYSLGRLIVFGRLALAHCALKRKRERARASSSHFPQQTSSTVNLFENISRVNRNAKPRELFGDSLKNAIPPAAVSKIKRTWLAGITRPYPSCTASRLLCGVVWSSIFFAKAICLVIFQFLTPHSFNNVCYQKLKRCASQAPRDLSITKHYLKICFNLNVLLSSVVSFGRRLSRAGCSLSLLSGFDGAQPSKSYN